MPPLTPDPRPLIPEVGSPLSALRYLTARSITNRLTRQALRLRRPRHAVGFVLGAAYLWLVLARPGGAAPIPTRPFGGAGPELAALALAMLAARWWLFGAERQALAFAPAEVDFLFPAPLTRRQLIGYKLLRAQLAIGVSAVLWTALVAARGGLPFPLRALAVWALLATLHMHQLGASLVRASTAEQGRAGIRRSIVPLALFAAAAGAVAWSVLEALPAIRAASGGLATARALGEALRLPAARVVLLPFRLLLAPTVAPDAGAWARAMLPALVLLAAHAVWVLRRDTAFEEAAAEASARRARWLQARRERRAPEPGSSGAPRWRWLPLAPAGSPAWAIIWKNVVAQLRALRAATLLRFVAAAGIGVFVASLQAQGNLIEVLGLIVTAWAMVLVVAGPLWVRNDLRHDLPRLALLRSYPLRGATIVGAEVAAAALTLTAAQAVMLSLAAVLLVAGGWVEHASPLRRALTLSMLVALPALNALSLCIQNALALLFPEWGRRGLAEPGGIELMGQNLLTALGSLILMLVALLPPGALAIWLGMRVWPTAGTAGVVAVALGASVLVLGETWLATRWLGSVFERTEPGAA